MKLLYENRRALPLVIVFFVFFGLLEWRFGDHLDGNEFRGWLVAVCLYLAKHIVVAFIWLDSCLNTGRNNNLAPRWEKAPSFLLAQGKFWSLAIIAFLFCLLPSVVIVVASQHYTNIAWWFLTLIPLMGIFFALVIQFRLSFLLLDDLSGQKSGVRSVWRKSKGFGRDMALALMVATVFLAAPILLLRYVWAFSPDEMPAAMLGAVLNDVAGLMFLSIMVVAYKEAANREVKNVSIQVESA